MTPPFSRIQNLMSLIAAAFGAAAAVRAHTRPSDADLRRLGIRAKDFPKSW
jgi:hypothetical protein